MTRGLIVALWIAALAITAYWTIWFLVDRSWLASLDTPAYYVFENAFPAADGWLAVAAVAAAETVRRGRPSAGFWLVACGSAALYLGLMDVLFDLQNGVYAAPDSPAVATEIAINVTTFGLAAWTLSVGWRWRATQPVRPAAPPDRAGG